MNAITTGTKFRFFGFLKNVFQKSATSAPRVVESLPRLSPPPIETAPRPVAAPAPAPVAKPGHNGQNGNGSGAARQDVAGVQVPLRAIIEGLPVGLRAKVVHADVGDLTIAVPLDKVLSQLAQGAVKLSFGELRASAPYVFAQEADSDRTPVSLPLNAILSQLNPALLVRRPAQKSVEVPSDITSPFESKGPGLVFSVGNNAKPVTPAAPRQVAPAPVIPARGSISSVVAPASEAALPGTSLPPSAPIPMPKPIAIAPAAPYTPRAPVVPVISPLIPENPFGMPRPAVAAIPLPTTQATQATQAAQPAKPAVDSGSLSVALKALAESWPEALRQEIVQSGLVDARVALPCDMIESGLKRGRAAFPWKILRSWIRPAPVPSVSVHDSAELELPLKIVAPLFLARQSSAKAQTKPAIDETIPNLFFGFPKPEPAPAAAPRAVTPTNLPTPSRVAASENLLTSAPKPVDTNYYVWNDTSDSMRVDESAVKRQGPSGTDFVTRYATPNEIVSRAAVLDGVAGVLIALPDGLMVASRIPPELNGDTLAAFLPQIFAKVNQCTRELRMGELNNLNFTVGNVPWKIFRVNAIFFAAFGRVAEPLPTAELAALAAELDRKR